MNAEGAHTDLSLDRLFECLADGTRRRLLTALLDRGPRAGLKVPEAIASGDEDVRTLRISMYHCHLPKLEAAGLVGWDRETMVVTGGPRFGELRPLVRLLREHDDDLPGDWP